MGHTIVATQPERIALLELQVDALAAEVHGDASHPWAQSIRGRLHSMQSAMASADLVREAAEASARAQSAAAHTLEIARGRRLSRWTQVALVVCGIVTAAAPYVLHFSG